MIEIFWNIEIFISFSFYLFFTLQVRPLLRSWSFAPGYLILTTNETTLGHSWSIRFDDKCSILTLTFQATNEDRIAAMSPLRLTVRRKDVFMDSYNQLGKGFSKFFKRTLNLILKKIWNFWRKIFSFLGRRTGQEMRGRLQVNFSGEEGVDAGGLVREWFGILAKEIFNPNYALFYTAGGKARWKGLQGFLCLFSVRFARTRWAMSTPITWTFSDFVVDL